MQPTRAAFQVFRVAIAPPALEYSAELAAPVNCGALRSLRQRTPGNATWGPAVAMQAGATSLSEMAYLSVASGINSFDNLT